MNMEIEEPPLHGKWLKKFLHIISKGTSVLVLLKKTGSSRLSQLEGTIVANRSLSINIVLLLVLTLIPWISDASVNRQVYTDTMTYTEPIDPVKAGNFSSDIQKFVPAVEVNQDEIALAIMQQSDNYTLSQQLALNTGKDIDGTPERPEATYTVAQGETITQIAEKFNLHVATILDANGIAPQDTKSIKQGVVLAIPSSDTSTSNDWLVALNKAESDAKAQAAATAAAEAAKKKLALVKAAASILSTSSKTASGYDNVDRGGISVPINYIGISRGFGNGHTGIDYRAPIGTSVAAAADGKVTKISTGWSGGYGNQIVVDHGGGRSTRYAHLSQINVSVGQVVSRGQNIGLSGSTGNSTGPHLHFELIINGRPVSPF